MSIVIRPGEKHRAWMRLSDGLYPALSEVEIFPDLFFGVSTLPEYITDLTALIVAKGSREYRTLYNLKE